MNFIPGKKGFSLIETLVVCVIVGILAAVSIPMYIGYVNNQRQVTVANLAETAAAAGNACYRRTGTILTITPILKNAAPLNLYFNDVKYSITLAGDSIIVSEVASGGKRASAAYK